MGHAAGGAGVSNSGAITTLTNNGGITGGAAKGSFADATGGAGVSNSGTIMTLTNSGMISGGGAAKLGVRQCGRRRRGVQLRYDREADQ